MTNEIDKELVEKIGVFWSQAKWDNLSAMDALALTKTTGALGKLLEKERGKWQSERVQTGATSSTPVESKEPLPLPEAQLSLKQEQADLPAAKSLSSTTTVTPQSLRGRAKR